ncbi:hypothetical protein CHEID_03795 [Corynebacterium heidelbergense]|nr:hypothetical protein CHEID_03795 [Corynebacterium heidelbergense]
MRAQPHPRLFVRDSPGPKAAVVTDRQWSHLTLLPVGFT